MITLKQALELNESELNNFKQDLKKDIKEKKEIGAYVEQLIGADVADYGVGIPIAIKDNIQVKNWDITCASKILQGYKAPYNATVVEKMLQNGLSPFGRCNMDEFAMGSSTQTSFYGKTKNPANLETVPGGSSGGSAACVAGGIAIAALGSDTGGSIRQPAAFCGCVGMKPTYGAVSRYGLSAFSSSLDQIGPLTQNVEDAAILYDIINGHDPLDSTSANAEQKKTAPNINPNRKLKIAVIENYVDSASEDIKLNILKNIEELKKAGHEIIYKQMMNFKYDIATYYIIATAEASTNLSRYDGIRYGNRVEGQGLKDLYKKTRGEGFGDEVKRRLLLGTFVLSSGYYDAYYIKAQKVRAKVKNEYNEMFKECDLILSPVTPTTAFKFGENEDPLDMYLNDMFTISVNLAGLPAISVPTGVDSGGLPIATQLIANSFDEQTLFDGAACLEALNA
jgi:aspartyl-tRNA(Asn)/glutamyl-tRNA(Gln) amidotransferase subunit A